MSAAPVGTSGSSKPPASTAEELASLVASAENVRVDVVQVSGLALMKIIKYSGDALLSGPLCGLLDRRQSSALNVLEVTDCFPSYTGDLADHQVQMLRSLREVNGDNNVVGWFHSTSLRGGFCDLKSVETHFMFEKRIKNAIYLVYDPVVSAATGSVALKALRFTPEFAKAYRDVDSAVWDLASMEHSTVFEEVPVHVYNSKLVRVYMRDLADEGLVSPSSNVLDLSSSQFFERTLQTIKDEVELERKIAFEEERRYRGGPAPDVPETRLDRMNVILAGTHIRSYTQQLYRFAKRTSDKLTLATRLAEE